MTQILYKQKSSMRRGETIRGMNFVSPLVEYKFYNQTSQQIYKKYFVDANPPLEGTFNIISDVASDVSDEIKKTVKDFYYYNKIEPQYFAFTVVMFSSTEATKLKECFEVSEPSDNEILIFVEDNKNDSASGTYGAIRISPKIIATLGPQNRLAYDVKDNKNIYDELKKIVPELTNDQIKSLLHNGYIEDTRINAIKTWLKIASFFSSGIDAIFPGLGILTNNMVRKATSDSLAKVIEKIEEARLEEYRWQPKAPKTENGEIDKNYNYQPLISVDEKDNATVNIAQFSSLLQKKLDEQDAFVKAKLKIYQKFDEKGEPNNLLEFLYHSYFKAYKVAKSTISQIQELSDIEILKYGVKAYNALLCGVWNGLVDAVSGLFAMVKMIYDGITLGKDFVQNIDKYLPTLLEQFDEAIQAIEKLNFTEIAKYIYEKLKDINLTFDPIACAYFIGYAYGFVLSLIIEIILTVVATGATLTIPVIVEKLSEALFGIFRLVWKNSVKIVRTFSRFVVKSVESIIKGFQELVNFLKKGWEEIKTLIDDVFKNFKKTVLKQFDDIEFINGYDIDKILKFEKPNRLDPSEYLSARYIKAHLKKFEKGASYLVPKKALDTYGRDVIGRLDGQFVMSKMEMDDLLKKAKGNLSYVEDELGIPPGAWKGKEIVRIDIPNVKKQNPRMATGNESGANDLWLPGGRLPKGYSEVVLDAVKKNDYKEINIKLK
ncbi:MAG: hypothetical protein E2590_16465 [Chryseobacterium sp.]|nr:hypothetical protein [Chryseobacterium sp.]